MELKLDLYKETKKSIFRIVFGIVFLILAIIGIYIKISRGKVIMQFDWLLYGMFTVNGIMHFVEGLGYRFESLFGKAYIWINDEFISLKPSAFNKGQRINWNEIRSINYKLNKFIIQKTDNTTPIIDLSKFEYVLNMKIKETIIDIAKEKNIKNNL